MNTQAAFCIHPRIQLLDAVNLGFLNDPPGVYILEHIANHNGRPVYVGSSNKMNQRVRSKVGEILEGEFTFWTQPVHSYCGLVTRGFPEARSLDASAIGLYMRKSAGPTNAFCLTDAQNFLNSLWVWRLELKNPSNKDLQQILRCAEGVTIAHLKKIFLLANAQQPSVANCGKLANTVRFCGNALITSEADRPAWLVTLFNDCFGSSQ